MHRLGIDLGGTKIEGVLLDPAGKECFRTRISTEASQGYEHILNQIKNVYEMLEKEIRGKLHVLGIGTPGALSRESGLLKNSNTTCLNGKPLQEDLEKVLGRKFHLQNDANCFALAETMYGAGRGASLVFGVIMGTGCGGGIVYEGKVITGLQSIAGEWGHMTIDPNGPECYCGKRGCVETLISGSGLERIYERETKNKLPLEEIVKKYRAGEEISQKIMNDFFENFGRGLANVINLLDPHLIVLGGGLSNIDELYTLGVAQVKRFVFNDKLETPIVKHKLGDSAGVIGAALIAE